MKTRDRKSQPMRFPQPVAPAAGQRTGLLAVPGQDDGVIGLQQLRQQLQSARRLRQLFEILLIEPIASMSHVLCQHRVQRCRARCIRLRRSRGI